MVILCVACYFKSHTLNCDFISHNCIFKAHFKSSQVAFIFCSTFQNTDTNIFPENNATKFVSAEQKMISVQLKFRLVTFLID